MEPPGKESFEINSCHENFTLLTLIRVMGAIKDL